MVTRHNLLRQSLRRRVTQVAGGAAFDCAHLKAAVELDPSAAEAAPSR